MYEKVKEVAEVLRTQGTDGNTENLPTYWTVQKKKRVYTADTYYADVTLIGFSDEAKVSVPDFKEQAAKKIESELGVTHPKIAQEYIEKLKALDDCDSIQVLLAEIAEEFALGYDWETDIVGYNTEWEDIPNHIFLTKRDANDYIKKFGYRYKAEEKPLRTYAYIAGDSPDVKTIISAVKETNWDEKSNLKKFLLIVTYAGETTIIGSYPAHEDAEQAMKKDFIACTGMTEEEFQEMLKSQSENEQDYVPAAFYEEGAYADRCGMEKVRCNWQILDLTEFL